MLSPRKIAKGVQYEVRKLQMRACAIPRALPWFRRRCGLPSNQTFDPWRDGDRHGVRVIRLDPGETFERPLPWLCEPDRAALGFFSARTHESTPPRYVAELESAIAWGHPTGGVLTADGQFIPAFSHDPAGAGFHAIWTRLSLPPLRALRGRTLYLVTPQAQDNYHHWLVDLLPRLGLVRRAGFDLGSFDHVIVNHVGRPYQTATLAKLGIAAERLIAADQALYVRAELLVVPSLKSDNQTMPTADLAFLRETFLGPSSVAGGRRRIYLSRADAAFRRLTNEAALQPILRAHGFESISLAAMDVGAQARLFAEAEIVAGPAGAAFANLVFATAPACVIEIAPPQWLAAFHWMISARLGLRHGILLGDGAVMAGIPNIAARRRDITLPPAKFAECLRSRAPGSATAGRR